MVSSILVGHHEDHAPLPCLVQETNIAKTTTSRLNRPTNDPTMDSDHKDDDDLKEQVVAMELKKTAPWCGQQ